MTSLIGTTVIISCANSVMTFCWQKSKKALTQTLSIYLRPENLQSNTMWLRAQKNSSICCRLIRTSFLLCFANHSSMITTKSIPRFRQSSHSAQQPLLHLCVGEGGFGPRLWQSMSISKHLSHTNNAGGVHRKTWLAINSYTFFPPKHSIKRTEVSRGGSQRACTSSWWK